MTRLLPRKPEPTAPENGHCIVELDEPAASEILDVLGTDTTRRVLESVYESPNTASEISDQLDISIQNTKYHLDKLREAGLIEVTGTWYSEQGNEMKVYGPTYTAFVVLAGDGETRSDLRSQLLAGAIVLGGVFLVSLVVEILAEWARGGYLGTPSGWSLEELLTALPLYALHSPGITFLLGAVTVFSLLFLTSYHRDRLC